MYKKGEKIFIAVCLTLAVVGGVTVNPLHQGTDVIYKNPLIQEIAAVVEEDGQGLWIVENMDFPYINIPIMVGAPTINCTNTYPDLERWELLDETGENEKKYNRYAHISIRLCEAEDVSFENPAPDQLHVALPVDQLKTLNVAHILTNQDLTIYNSENIQFDLVNQIENYRIYNVKYTEV